MRVSQLLAVRTFLANVTLFLPGVILAVLLSAMMASTVARWLGSGKPVSALWLVAIGAILAATLTPTAEAISGDIVSARGCNMTLTRLASLAESARTYEFWLNNLLFMPLGFAVSLLPRSRRSLVVLAAAVMLPLLIEFTQGLFTELGRQCQSADIVANLAGLLLGPTVGWVTCG